MHSLTDLIDPIDISISAVSTFISRAVMSTSISDSIAIVLVTTVAIRSLQASVLCALEIKQSHQRS